MPGLFVDTRACVCVHAIAPCRVAGPRVGSVRRFESGPVALLCPPLDCVRRFFSRVRLQGAVPTVRVCVVSRATYTTYSRTGRCICALKNGTR